MHKLRYGSSVGATNMYKSVCETTLWQRTEKETFECVGPVEKQWEISIEP